MVGINGFEPHVEETSSNTPGCFALGLSLAWVTLDEPECSKPCLELFQRLQRRGCSESFRHALLHGLR